MFTIGNTGKRSLYNHLRLGETITYVRDCISYILNDDDDDENDGDDDIDDDIDDHVDDHVDDHGYGCTADDVGDNDNGDAFKWWISTLLFTAKPCRPNPCDHGVCSVNTTTGFKCTCDVGYSGILCDRGKCYEVNERHRPRVHKLNILLFNS